MVGEILADRAVESSNTSTVPALEDEHVNAGVELKVTVWRIAEEPEPPPPEYCGIFRVFVDWVQVAAPLLPVVVSVIGRLVRFEALPLEGVPSAPPKVTKAPAEPTLIASAVPTPVPSPAMPPIGTVLAAIEPVPIAATAPDVLIWIPLEVPWAVNVKGCAVEVPTVLTSNSDPVPVFPVASMIENILDVLVLPWTVMRLVNVPTLMPIFPVGLVNADHDVDALPEQELKTGVPPLTDTRQSVPAPPVAVA
jgi:hypothetical protein